MHCTALHWWFAPSIVMCLASAETFSPCAGCELHYDCVFVCLRYWLLSPALLCNAKLIWPVVFLSGKSLHFSCNPSQWRSYCELSIAPSEQHAHMEWIGSACVFKTTSPLIVRDLHTSAKPRAESRPQHLVATFSPFRFPSSSLHPSSYLPSSPFYLSFPPLSLSLSFWWGGKGSVQGEVECPSAGSFKAPFPPRQKVSCILKHSIVSAVTLAWCSQEEQRVCLLCMYVFQSGCVFLPTCVNVSFKDLYYCRWLFGAATSDCSSRYMFTQIGCVHPSLVAS